MISLFYISGDLIIYVHFESHFTINDEYYTVDERGLEWGWGHKILGSFVSRYCYFHFYKTILTDKFFCFTVMKRAICPSNLNFSLLQNSSISFALLSNRMGCGQGVVALSFL